MKHYYHSCPDNPEGPTPWYAKDTDCTRCLQKLVLQYEREYRKYQEDAVVWLTEEMEL